MLFLLCEFLKTKLDCHIMVLPFWKRKWISIIKRESYIFSHCFFESGFILKVCFIVFKIVVSINKAFGNLQNFIVSVLKDLNNFVFWRFDMFKLTVFGNDFVVSAINYMLISFFQLGDVLAFRLADWQTIFLKFFEFCLWYFWCSLFVYNCN